MCLGGDIMGDFDRWRDASRDRLLERPRTRAVMAPKKSAVARDVGDAGDIGGDDDCEFCESSVPVRTGCMGWKLDWDVMIGASQDVDVRKSSSKLRYRTGVDRADGKLKYSAINRRMQDESNAAQTISIYTQSQQFHSLPPTARVCQSDMLLNLAHT
jgi:hypothetical protein